MKPEENECTATGNQLESLNAAPEGTQCSPVHISPPRVSVDDMVGTKNGSHRTDVESQEGHKKKDRRPTESGDYWEVFQGVTRIKSEDPLAEGFLPSYQTRRQKDARGTEPHIEVKSEKSDDCSSHPLDPRAEGGIILTSEVTGEEGTLTDFQTSVLLRLQTLEEAQIEMLQLLRSLIGVNKTAEELDEVLPASTHEELGRLCERLADQTFKKQLKCYLTSLGGRNVGDTVRRMLRKIGTNFLWGGYSLKGKKGKIAFIDLPVARVIIRACMTNHPNARICDVEMEIAECLKHAPNKRGGLKYKPPPPKRVRHNKSSASSSPSDTDDEKKICGDQF